MQPDHELERHASILLQGLTREFGETVDPGYIEEIGHGHFERLLQDARVLDYIPVLVYRAVRDELLEIRHDELHHAA